MNGQTDNRFGTVEECDAWLENRATVPLAL